MVVTKAESEVLAKAGMLFMHEFHELVTQQEKSRQQPRRIVQVISDPYFGHLYFPAAPANFGMDLAYTNVDGEMVLAAPFDACTQLSNGEHMKGKVAVVVRSGCMFQEKARNAQDAGAVAVIVLDNNHGSVFEPFFAMSGEEHDDPGEITVPVVLLFNVDGQKLIHGLKKFGGLKLRVAELIGNPAIYVEQYLLDPKSLQRPAVNRFASLFHDPLYIDVGAKEIEFNFHFGKFNGASASEEKQQIVEDNIVLISESLKMPNNADKDYVLNVARTLAYGQLGFEVTASEEQLQRLASLLPEMTTVEGRKLRNPVVTVKCSIDDNSSRKCNRV